MTLIWNLQQGEHSLQIYNPCQCSHAGRSLVSAGSKMLTVAKSEPCPLLKPLVIILKSPTQQPEVDGSDFRLSDTQK